MKILTVVGARPQFIKASVVSKQILAHPGLIEVMVHTGQHFDANMSQVFFEQLKIPKPDYTLDIRSTLHGDMTGRMLIELEKILLKEKPDRVLVYGDTNSTLAGALAASKLHIPISHVEAGLRSFNMKMPEEINRILTDQISSQLFCPTERALTNLINEGFSERPVGLYHVGDVMLDSVSLFSGQSAHLPKAIPSEDYILATFHRAENTDHLDRLTSLVNILNDIHQTIAPVVVPLHPRTRVAIKNAGLKLDVCIIDPVGYVEMLALTRGCKLVMTDSGGLQKEGFFLNKACLTLRAETEWTELVEMGANFLVDTDPELIKLYAKSWFGKSVSTDQDLFGSGDASAKVVELLFS